MIKHLLCAALVLYALVSAILQNVPAIGSITADIPLIANRIPPTLPGGTVCARKPLIVWFLNEHRRHFPAFTHVPIPNQDLLATLRRDRIDYLFLSGIEYRLRPETRPWFNLKNVPPDFEIVGYAPKFGAVLYKINHSKSPLGSATP